MMTDAGDFLSYQEQWRECPHFDDSIRIGAAIARCFAERPNGNREEMALAALQEWQPCPCRLELPN